MKSRSQLSRKGPGPAGIASILALAFLIGTILALAIQSGTLFVVWMFAIGAFGYGFYKMAKVEEERFHKLRTETKGLEVPPLTLLPPQPDLSEDDSPSTPSDRL